MKVQKIFYTSKFEKAFKRLPKDIKTKAINKEKIFRRNCFDPRLKTHKLKGKFSNRFAFSVDYSYRILFRFRKKKNEVIFENVGPHSIYR